MSYDIEQIKNQIDALNISKENTMQTYHKICGAIEILNSMLDNLSRQKEEEENNDVKTDEQGTEQATQE